MISDLNENTIHYGLGNVEFTTDDEAENYVVRNPEKMAVVCKNGILISTYYGNDYGSRK